MPKVSGEDVFLKSFLIEDADTVKLGIPIDDFTVFFGLSSFGVTHRMLHNFSIKEAGLS